MDLWLDGSEALWLRLSLESGPGDNLSIEIDVVVHFSQEIHAEETNHMKGNRGNDCLHHPPRLERLSSPFHFAIGSHRKITLELSTNLF